MNPSTSRSPALALGRYGIRSHGGSGGWTPPWWRQTRAGVALAAMGLGLTGCGSSAGPMTPSGSQTSRAGETAAFTLRGEKSTGDRPFAPAPSRGPRDAFVLFSGGGTPLSNHYSQYLQARAMTAFFGRTAPADATWVFFGVGNRPDEPPRLADAHRTTARDGLKIESWVPGTLRGNRPATRESFLTALRNEILPVVRDGGTLFLFVGDHGELTDGDDGESAVTMWQLKPGGRRGSGWRTDEKEILTVSELRQVLADGLGRGRVVFCMTQCHSGGFHFLSVPREVTPPRAWFTSWPEWARTRKTAAPLLVAGFTATDEESIAAGCTSEPDPEQWVGYERFAPEALLGMDLLSEKTIDPPRRTLALAHEAATLVDRTLDKPRATSEQFLERWAVLVETQLATETHVTDKTKRAVAAFTRAVDTGVITATSADLRSRQEQFQRFTGRLAEQNPAVQDLLLTGTRQELEAASKGGGNRPGRGGGNRRGAAAEARKAWTDTLRPAWKAAVLARGSTLLTGPALAFEKHLLQLEDRGRDLLLPRGGNALLNEVYWNSSYANPPTFEAAKAEAVTRWSAERRARIVSWGRASADAALRAAAEKIGTGPVASAAPSPSGPPAPISRATAAQRGLFYRRVLAAWEFLLAMEERPALERLHQLIEIEQTELPIPAT